jgi:serine/threonine-protein kinase
MIGKTISRYHILEKLGQGGMGIVFKAKDESLNRFVALKFLPAHLSDEESGKARFIQEAKTASALDHPNICTIYEVSRTDDGQLFIAMAYYEGETLRDKISRAPIPMAEAIDIATQVAHGLNRAHQNGIIHRDIKPANIMITNLQSVKILDFGLAKLADEGQLTRTGETLGTAAYMSPEQLQGMKLDHRSDIFAWGVVFFEMLAGRLPFEGDYPQALMYAILNDTPPPIRRLHPNAPEEVELIVSRALAKNPAERYQQTSELVADLQVINRQLESGTRTAEKLHASTAAAGGGSLRSRTSRILKNSKRKIAAVAVAAMLIVLLIPNLNRLLDIVTAPDERHIAVLSFANIGDAPENQALCDGLVETLTSKLSQLEQFEGSFWVVPASEVRSNKVTSASQARQLFGANMVITGSVQKFDNLLRLTMNLIDANSMRQLASHVIDDPMTGGSILQDEVVLKLAEMLNVGLLPETRGTLMAGSTTAPGAYEFYLQGRGTLQDYDKLENVDSSIELFNRSLQADPDYALAYAGLGEAYLRKYQLTKQVELVNLAQNNCQRALDLNDLIAPVHITRGLLSAETGQHQQALIEFQKALEIEPQNAEAQRGRAQAFTKLGELDKAEEIYKKAITLKPDYWGGYNDLGVFYYRQGRYEEAIPQFKNVIALTPQNAKGHRNLGSMYFSLNRREEAIAAFNEALKIDPNYSTYSNVATLYFSDGNYADAARMYEKALELRDTDYRVWGNLAAAYKNNPAEREKAEQAFRQAIIRCEEQLRIKPRDPSLLLSLAAYYVEFGNYEKSLVLVKQAAASKDKDVDIMLRIGSMYEQLQNRDEALTWIEKALSNGYSVSKLESLPTLSNLRNDERYKSLVLKLQQK